MDGPLENTINGNENSEDEYMSMIPRSIQPSRAWVWLITMVLGINLSSCGKELHVSREVTVSPGHYVTPYRLERMKNGDYVLAGSVGSNYRAWAARVTSSGAPVWEFVDGGADGWTDTSAPGQQVLDIVELPDQSVLLCGIKTLEKRDVGFLAQVSANGTVLFERLVQPRKDGSPFGLHCTRWGDGVAISGMFFAGSDRFGWLAKLDDQGEIVWEKFGDDYGYLDLMPGSNGGLVLLTSVGHQGIASIVSVDAQGEVIGSQVLAKDSNDPALVRTQFSGSTVRVAYMQDDRQTVIADFAGDLKSAPKIHKIGSTTVKRAIELIDGTVVVFGSQFKGGPTASMAWLSPNGSARSALLGPAYSSPWFLNAVPSGEPYQFATVRNVGNAATLAWISLK